MSSVTKLSHQKAHVLSRHESYLNTSKNLFSELAIYAESMIRTKHKTVIIPTDPDFQNTY